MDMAGAAAALQGGVDGRATSLVWRFSTSPGDGGLSTSLPRHCITSMSRQLCAALRTRVGLLVADRHPAN